MIKSRIGIFMIVVSLIAALLMTFNVDDTMAKTKVIKLSHPLPDFDVMVQGIMKFQGWHQESML